MDDNQSRLIKEKEELSCQVENTKRYLGSVITTADPKERISKEFRMVKEMTDTIIDKDNEIHRLREDYKNCQTHIRMQQTECLKVVAEIERKREANNLLVALIKHLSDISGIKSLTDQVTEFISRLSSANDSKEFFDMIVDNLATLQVN